MILTAISFLNQHVSIGAILPYTEEGATVAVEVLNITRKADFISLTLRATENSKGSTRYNFEENQIWVAGFVDDAPHYAPFRFGA